MKTLCQNRESSVAIAERAREWVERMHHSPTNSDRERFLAWMRESPDHVREFLLNSTRGTLLEHMLDPECHVSLERCGQSAAKNVAALTESVCRDPEGVHNYGQYDPASQIGPRVLVPETVVQKMVRLIGEVADLQAERAAKRRTLMTGLTRMVDADAWAWVISRGRHESNIPEVASFQHGGFSDEQLGPYVQLMRDRRNMPVEYAALNRLRLSKKRFTRRWDQLVTADEWYGPRNRSMLEVLGFEHVMHSVRIREDDELFSDITLKRKVGRENFSPLEQRIAHIVIGEIDWLHLEGDLPEVAVQMPPLSPIQRTVLMLLMEGVSKPKIAEKLGCGYSTIKEHVRSIYIHFRVRSTPELFRHFMAGDGCDVN